MQNKTYCLHTYFQPGVSEKKEDKDNIDKNCPRAIEEFQDDTEISVIYKVVRTSKVTRILNRVRLLWEYMVCLTFFKAPILEPF